MWPFYASEQQPMLNAKKPDNILIKFQIMSLGILKCEFDVAKRQKTKLKMMSKM